jgi:hypothetical protein
VCDRKRFRPHGVKRDHAEFVCVGHRAAFLVDESPDGRRNRSSK